MEYETINKETPEMKQLISGIKGLTNRVRSIAQTHRPLFEGEIYLTGREVCERLFCPACVVTRICLVRKPTDLIVSW